MRYRLIKVGFGMYLVLDTMDGKRKWISKDEMLEDIFTDPVFADIAIIDD